MKIFIATDHAGFELKNTLVTYITEELGIDVVDCGAFDFDESDDYPDFISVAINNLVAETESARAIILGGSGTGEAIVANRYPGVRAAVYYGGPEDIIILSREHNDTNVLSLGARFIDEETAKSAVSLWLATEFSGEERHQRRIQKIDGEV